jgi:hypothetical protein
VKGVQRFIKSQDIELQQNKQPGGLSIRRLLPHKWCQLAVKLALTWCEPLPLIWTPTVGGLSNGCHFQSGGGTSCKLSSYNFQGTILPDNHAQNTSRKVVKMPMKINPFCKSRVAPSGRFLIPSILCEFASIFVLLLDRNEGGQSSLSTSDKPLNASIVSLKMLV